jgi:transposase-like protein
MPNVLYCPNCKTSRECIKKGKNKKNEQLFQCKNCGKRFSESLGTLPPPTSEKTKVKKSPETTEIYLNNNLIKKIDSKLTIDDAFEIISSYVKNISKDNVKIISGDDTTIFKFTIQIGTKG